MTAEEFRQMALEMPGASEGSHMGKADFRAGGRIFATLWEDEANGVVKLTLDQQEEFVDVDGETFAPVKGGWGRQGYTQVRLARADAAAVRRAVETAWGNVTKRRK